MVEELNKLWPLASLPSPYQFRTLEESVYQHCIRNPEDWSTSYLLDQLDIIGCSRTLFFLFLEATVSPNARRDESQKKLVEALNQHLKADGYHFQTTGAISGYPVFKILPVSGGVTGAPKNLIFAAIGAKPEIVLSEAINNDIKIVKNADKCLVYDRPLGNDGLSKLQMIEWWQDRENIVDGIEARKSLYLRLAKSLDSEGEKNVFRTYYQLFKKRGDNFPALIPQVYLHYDPYTVKQLGGIKRLTRQRMDFLLLLSSAIRIVIEVDGKQHFANDDTASLPKYAEMMSADRDLRLVGYEVYRFGANELCGNTSTVLIEDFFTRLLNKHGV